MIDNIKEKLSEIDWDLLLSYKTFHMVRVFDKKLFFIHYVVLISLFLAFLINTVIIGHSYQYVETPSGSLTFWAEQPSNYDDLIDKDPWYCDNSTTNYVYSYPNWVYENNTCSDRADFQQSGESVFNIKTYVQEVKYYVNISSDPPTLESYDQINYFIPNVEYNIFYFTHLLSTSSSNSYKNPKTKIVNKDGKEFYTFEKDQEVGLPINEWLKIADANLDKRNPNSGGLSTFGWPYYRMTGIFVQMNLDYTNVHKDKPFDTTPTCVLTVSSQTETWSSLGDSVVYIEYPTRFVGRYSYAIQFQFSITGTIGYFDTGALFQSLIGGIVVVGVSTVVVDILALYILPSKREFREMKFENFSLN